MIEFHSDNEFVLKDENIIVQWLQKVIEKEDCSTGELSYVFCNDEYLHAINMEFLGHDTLTDIITFDYSLGSELHGEIYISTERVVENAAAFGVTLDTELQRVLAHGVLHLCGFDDKTDTGKFEMRKKEDQALVLLKDLKKRQL